MVELSPAELTRRIAAGPPNVYLVDRMPEGRIVHAVLEHENVSRIHVYVMSTKTWQRANANALTQFGSVVKNQPFIAGAKIMQMEPTTVNIRIVMPPPIVRAQADGDAVPPPVHWDIALPTEWQAL